MQQQRQQQGSTAGLKLWVSEESAKCGGEELDSGTVSREQFSSSKMLVVQKHFDDMTAAELKAELKARQLTVGGKKAELKERLRADMIEKAIMADGRDNTAV